jgi:geranylgeranyl diphosphate synthase type I
VSAGDLAERAARYRAAVASEMRAVVGDAPDALFGWMRYHLGWEDAEGRGTDAPAGKMLRPTALLLAHEICGGDAAQAVSAAAAVELIHNFSLLHDDVEDVSETRRGRATLWTFAGLAQAINTGDGMYTVARLAMYRLLDAGLPAARVVDAMREIDEACLRLVHGQSLDIDFERRREVSRDEYLEMTAGKTAAMFASPFATGAILAGAPPASVEAFRRFGHHVGLAFQAVDDVLGIWGDPAVTGKPVGDDLRQRKMTLPVIEALAAGGEVTERIAAVYAEEGARDEDVASLSSLSARAGGRAATEDLARQQVRTGLDALRAAGSGGDATALCAEFAAAAIGRVA